MLELVTDSQRRDALAREVFRHLRRNEVPELAVVLEDGTKPLVFALSEDLLSDVMHRVNNAGGAANVWVQMSDEIVLVLAHRPVLAPRNVPAFGPGTIHQDINMGMFVEAVLGEYTQGVITAVRLPRHHVDLEVVKNTPAAV